MQEIDLSQEFSNPDINFLILLKEMEEELKLIQLDLTQIKSPIVKGAAQKIYIDLKERYFYLLAKDLELLKMYESQQDEIIDEQNSDNNFKPM